MTPVFLLVALGAALRRSGWLTPEADASLLKVTVRILVPCLMISTLGEKVQPLDVSLLLRAPLMGFGMVALGFGLARLLLPYTRLKEPMARRSFVLAVGMHNYGFVPVPLVLAMYDPSTLAVLFVFNLGTEVASWGLGLATLRGWTGPSTFRALLNPGVFGVLIGVTLNLSMGKSWVPSVFWSTADLLAVCAIPSGLVLSGATLADFLNQMKSWEGWRPAWWGVFLRHLVIPPLILIVAITGPWDVELQRILIIQAAMGAAIFPVILCKHYGGDPSVALRIALLSTFISYLTIPLWLGVGWPWLIQP